MGRRYPRLAPVVAIASLGLIAWWAAHRDAARVPVAPAPPREADPAPTRSSVRETPPEEGGMTLHSPEAGVRAAFDPGGIVVTRGDVPEWSLRLRTTGIGRGGIRRPASGGAPALEGEHVAYEHAWGREWYVKRAGGVEQLFEVRERLSGEGPLEIHVEAAGLAMARVMRHKAVFASGTKAVLEYGKLLVRDARGSAIPAEMAGEGGRLRLIIEDRLAAYPLLVDPLLGPPLPVPDRATWKTDGAVGSVVPDGAGAVYIGGDFTRVSPFTGSGVALNMSTGFPDVLHSSINGPVLAVAPDGKGGWYIGGAFTRVQDVPRNCLAHLFFDGRLDPSWNPDASGEVYALAVAGSTVYAGGAFTAIGGTTRIYVAAIDAATGGVTAWNPAANSPVYALAVDGSALYAGGSFTIIGGQGRNRIAAFDASTGAIRPWNPGANSLVLALEAAGPIVYAGGYFTSIGGGARNRIAALEASTGLASAWNPNADGAVGALAVAGPVVYAGGEFTAIGGAARSYVASIDAATGSATAWSPSLDGGVRAIAVDGSNVYVGGAFSTIGGAPIPYLGAINAASGAPLPWVPGPDSVVTALEVVPQYPWGSVLYAGGYFTGVGGVARNRIAAIDAATGLATPWNPSADSDVLGLAVDGSTVYAGGSFSFIGGAPRNHIAALDRSTGMATSWDPSADSDVYRLLVDGSTLYAGGQFTTIGGAPRTSLAAISMVTGAATSWNPNVGTPSAVTALAVDGPTLYLGGDFASVGGLPRNRLAAVDVSTGAVLAWNPDANSSVNAIVVGGSTVYVGGWFNFIGVSPRNHIAAIDAASGLPTAWDPDADSQVIGLAVDGTTVYAAGAFTSIGGASRSLLAGLDASTGAATPWDPGFDEGWVRAVALAVDANTLYVGGLSVTSAGQLGNGLAAFSVTRAEQVTSPSPNGAYTTGQAIPIEVVFSGNVIVTGTPRLILQTGELDTPAPYTGGSGTGTLTFTYTVASTDVSNDLEVVSALALDLNGGTLSDSAGNPITIQLPPPFHNGSLSVNKDFLINGGYPTTPLITSPSPGSVVNTSTPILAGTAEPFVLVLVFIESASIVSVPADGAGAWSLAVSLAEGPHSLRVAAGRFNGPLGPLSSPFSLTVDTIGPTVQILSPPDGSFTDEVLLSLSGVTEAGARIAVYDGPISLGTVTASSAGSWSFMTLPLAEGAHSFSAVAADAASNFGPFSPAVGVTVDRTPPATPAISTPADGTTTSSNVVVLAGTAVESNAAVQVFDGPTLLGSASANGSGAWTFSTAPLPNGVHVFSVQVLDAAGNVSGRSPGVSVTVSSGVGPSIEITSPTSNPTHVSSTAVVDLGGTATDAGAGTAVSWTNQTTGASGAAAGTTVWSAGVPLTGGTNVIVIALSGATGTATDVIAVDYAPPPDVTPPTLTVTVPAISPATALSSPVTIQGTAGDDRAVSFVRWSNAVTGGTGVASGTTAWSADVPVVPGDNPITITAFDASGNATARTVTVNLVPGGTDVIPPTIAVTDPTTSPTITSSVDRIRIGGAAADETLLVTVVWSNGATGETATAIGLDPWSAEVSLVPGPNVITFTASDSSGNLGQDTVTVTYAEARTTMITHEEKCGLLGVEALFLLALLAKRRRRATSWGP